MTETYTYTISDQEAAHVRKTVQSYAKQINETPALQSLLYDIDLLPEQIRFAVNATRMAAFCMVFRKLTKDQIDSLFESTKTDEPKTGV